MILLDALTKVIYKPRAAFEEIKGNTEARDGIVLWVLLSMVSLVMYGIIANAAGISEVVFNFGFASMTPLGIVGGMVQGIVMLVLLAGIATKIAVRLGGTGNFSELVGMLGYARMLVVPKTFASMIMLIVVLSTVNKIYDVVGIGGSVDVVGSVLPLIYVLVILFKIWFYWIGGTAISVSNEISFARGLAVMVIAGVLISLIISGVGLLIGYELVLYF